ncbi:galactose-6-phosphate isomerase subunit LacA [Spiroplasma litorale]|uniref:Galactose-6-phosphate isomerase subunit LacA n=1 Tax=Spiroplasma litorale TaxID=216942 RepID=A0A0K1W2C6_9MOLU|nr:RpiB/LacA/LacB family sugar-phosphate isomerase [Spiroplasma litorale]AKX34318.1 galactose-6-phosphate isomerase subunit LacA [Spiroplasma litorale]
MEKLLIYTKKDIDLKYLDFIKQGVVNNKFAFIYQNEVDFFSDMESLAKKIQNKEIDRIIVLDEFGSLPFMILSKFKKIVVAQISDYHSAKMTIKHNNSNVLSLGYKILAKENLLNIINSYLNSKFEAGRHMVRINMLENLLEEE